MRLGKSSRFSLFLNYAMKNLVIIMLFVLNFMFCGCATLPNYTWSCKNESGDPLEGVFVVAECHFPSGPIRTVDYFYSNSDGIIYLNTDKLEHWVKGHPKPIIRFSYSEKTHSGGYGFGSKKVGSNPMILVDAGPKEDRETIFRNGRDFPDVWHNSLMMLHEAEYQASKRLIWNGPGVEIVISKMTDILTRESKLFLDTHGDKQVPDEYLKHFKRKYMGDFSGVTTYKKLTPPLKFN